MTQIALFLAPGRDDGLKFGEYDEKKKLYQEQRKAETRDFFAKVSSLLNQVLYWRTS